jgi:hypothetical protein
MKIMENVSVSYKKPCDYVTSLGHLGWNYTETLEKIKRATSLSVEVVELGEDINIRMKGPPDNLREALKTLVKEQGVYREIRSVSDGVGVDDVLDYTSRGLRK